MAWHCKKARDWQCHCVDSSGSRFGGGVLLRVLAECAFLKIVAGNTNFVPPQSSPVLLSQRETKSLIFLSQT